MGKSAVGLSIFFLHTKPGYNFYRRLKPFFLFRINLLGLTSVLFFLFKHQGQRQRIETLHFRTMRPERPVKRISFIILLQGLRQQA